jgi:Protein of unknown function (DUF2934)
MSNSQASDAPPRPIGAPMTPGAEERREMISVAAYYRAERRGFAPGGAEEDWLGAEADIDRLLTAMARQGITREDYEHAGLRHALRLWVE